MKIDINKKYRTRDGKKPEHLHRAPDSWTGAHPWRGMIGDSVVTWTDEGRFLNPKIESALDLIEVREPLEAQLVVDVKGKIPGFPGSCDVHWYDRTCPDHAPHRLVAFIEKTPTSETP